MSEQSEDSFYLSDSHFNLVVAGTPLVSIDLVVLCSGHVLLGKRLNRPAQGFWFVPGGRIRKGECLSDAYHRLTKAELGIPVRYKQEMSLGVYEHFYSDSVFGDAPSTHYIAIGMLVELSMPIDDLPQDQHTCFAWWPIEQALESLDVHTYTKDYLTKIGD